MRFRAAFLVITSALVVSVLSWGQPQILEKDSLLVRMSFTSTWAADHDPEGLEGSPQICFSVDGSGHYQMRRLTMKVTGEPAPGNPDGKLFPETPKTEFLQGTLPGSELAKLKKLLDDPEFVKLSGPAPRLLLQGAETLVAEVPREDWMQRVVMSDADGKNPFPRSAERIVKWMQHFKAKGGEALDVSAADICPREALRSIDPVTAWFESSSSAGGCGTR